MMTMGSLSPILLGEKTQTFIVITQSISALTASVSNVWIMSNEFGIRQQIRPISVFEVDFTLKWMIQQKGNKK